MLLNTARVFHVEQIPMHEIDKEDLTFILDAGRLLELRDNRREGLETATVMLAAIPYRAYRSRRERARMQTLQILYPLIVVEA